MMFTDRKYLLKSTERTARSVRFIAKAIDLMAVLLFSVFFYPLGIFLSIAYLAVADYLQNGESIGKCFMGLAVVSLEDGSPCSVKQSTIRNLPMIIPLLFALIPFWGPIFAVLLGIPLIVLEIYLLIKLDSGHRLGDVMADTTVIANDPHRADIRKKRESWFKSNNVPSTIN